MKVEQYAGDSTYEAVSGYSRIDIDSYIMTVDQYHRRGRQFEQVTCLGAQSYNSLYKAHGTGECDTVANDSLTWTSCFHNAQGVKYNKYPDCSTSNSSYTASVPNLGFPAAYTTESLSRLSYKWTETTNDAAGTNAPNQIYTFNSDWSSTLSHEYTTAMLFDDVNLDLLECGLLLQVPWGSDVAMGVGCANTTNMVGDLASKTLSADERTAHMVQGHYRARLSGTETGVVYRLAWIDRFVSVAGVTNDTEVVDVIVGNGSVVYTDFREAHCLEYGTRRVIEKELVATIQDIGITGGTVNSHELDDGDGNALTRQYVVPMTTGGSVSVACVLDPSWANQFVPDCFSFTGGLATSNQLVRLVPTDLPGEVDLYAAIGTNWASVKVFILSVDMDHDLWWFNGEDPGGGYNITATLTVSPLTTGTFKWDVIAGSDKVDLNNGGADADSITATDDNTVTVKSTSPSAAAAFVTKDVTVQLTYNGTPVCTFDLAVFAPHSLHHLANIDHDYAALPPPYPDYTGYWCEIKYEILDQFDRVLPYDVPWNEDFNKDGANPVSGISDYSGENWGWGPESGWSVPPSGAIDNLARPDLPGLVPPAQNVGSGTVKVDHVIGAWYVGSTTIGDGVLVLDNNKWQMYQDHGRHE